MDDGAGVCDDGLITGRWRRTGRAFCQGWDLLRAHLRCHHDPRPSCRPFASTSSQLAVIGGVFTIAVADSLSDALGIHVSEEAEGVHSQREVWTATIATFASKLLMALTFAIPVILLDLDAAVVVSILWGALALSVLSWNLARSQGVRAGPVVSEHLVVAALVIVAAHLIGRWISSVFS